jgi:hypothetical protein
MSICVRVHVCVHHIATFIKLLSPGIPTYKFFGQKQYVRFYIFYHDRSLNYMPSCCEKIVEPS